jgi:hypothetical protein
MDQNKEKRLLNYFAFDLFSKSLSTCYIIKIPLPPPRKNNKEAAYIFFLARNERLLRNK